MSDISIGRFRGGLCVYWWRDGKRIRHQLKARTPKDAEAEAVEVYRKENYKAQPVGLTVSEIWATYVADLGDKPTATTMGYTGKAVLPFFGAYTPQSITKELCREYARERATAGKKQGTIWTELGHLASALSFGSKTRMVEGPAPHIWRPAKPETDKRILDHSEIRRLIDAAHAPHIRLALILLFGTGARVGAILDLEWKRVDFDQNTINLRVDDSVTRKGRAIVPMNKGTRAALSVARDAALSDFVVEHAGGRINNIRKGVYNAVERAGLGRVTIHEFRHTAAVHMLGAGIPLEKVSQVLGHSNTAITYKTYARFLPEQMNDAIDVLDFTSFKKREA